MAGLPRTRAWLADRIAIAFGSSPAECAELALQVCAPVCACARTCTCKRTDAEPPGLADAVANVTGLLGDEAKAEFRSTLLAEWRAGSKTSQRPPGAAATTATAHTAAAHAPAGKPLTSSKAAPIPAATASPAKSGLRASAPEFRPSASAPAVPSPARPPAAHASAQSQGHTRPPGAQAAEMSKPGRATTAPAASLASAPDRIVCACACVRHPLFMNCIECGRIMCAAEADVTCIFCGAALRTMGGTPVDPSEAASMRVCARERDADAAARVLDATHRGGGSARPAAGARETAPRPAAPAPSSTAVPVDAGLARALAHKDTLLEYDRSSAARTKVYDDQADYFSTAWMSPAERAAAAAAEAERREKAHGSRGRDIVIGLDFAGRGQVQIRDVEAERRAAVEASTRAAVTGPKTFIAPAGELYQPAVTAFGLAHGASHFENTTLSGRAAEVYTHMMSVLRGGAHPAGDTGEPASTDTASRTHARAHTSVLQHDGEA